MEIIKKTNILVKTQREFVIYEEQMAIDMRCELCDGQIIAVQYAADRFEVSSRQIYRWLETKRIHFIETGDNEIFVCPDSIKKILEAV